MARVIQQLRRRRRLLGRPLLQTTSLRLHGSLANHPDQHSRPPANLDLPPAKATPVGPTAFQEAPHSEAAVSYAATVGHHLRCGDLPRAEALFRAAPASARNARLDNVMLDGYAKAGRFDDARRLFDGMAAKDVVAWSTLVSGYCRAGRFREAHVLFDAMPARDVVSWTAMVQGYARAGMLTEAREMFDEMPQRNVVAWTAMVQGYARSGMLREAREMFDAMPERNVVSWRVMVKAYADHGRFQEAVELFDRMPWRNSYSWNAMISGFLRVGRVDEAVHLFERMHHRSVVTWTAMVTGLALNGRVSMAREFFDRMPENKDIMAWNAMITAYAKDGQMSEARRLFDLMPAKDQMSWNIIIDGYAKNVRKDKAAGLFLLMLRSAVSPDSTTLLSVIVTSRSKVEVGQIHGMATKTGLVSETSLGNALLTMYWRSGDLPAACQAFKMLQEKDAITWTSMMQALVNLGRASCALQAFAQMLRHGHDPSSTTFIAALSACRQVGLVEKGQNIFRSIYVYGLNPTVEHRDILVRTERAREATEAIAPLPPETYGREIELEKRKKRQKTKGKRKRVEDRKKAIEEPAKGVFGWAMAYLKALVGK